MDTRMTKRRNFSDKFKATVALEALEEAIAKYGKPGIMDTDGNHPIFNGIRS